MDDDARLRDMEERLRQAGLRLQFDDGPEGVTAAVVARRDLGTGRAEVHTGADRLQAAERAYAAWSRHGT